MRIKTIKYFFPVIRQSLQTLIFLENAVLRKQPVIFLFPFMTEKVPSSLVGEVSCSCAAINNLFLHAHGSALAMEFTLHYILVMNEYFLCHC